MKKHVKERRAKALELGKREGRARCQHCKDLIPQQRLEAGFRFCSEDCEEDELAVLDAMVRSSKETR